MFVSYSSKMVEEERVQAPFNMALDTLKRLSDILKDIRIFSSTLEIGKGERQEIKVSLVKQFFIQSTPLLEEDAIEKYKEQVLALKPTLKKILNRKGLVVEIISDYNSELETKLDNIVIELQLELQKKGHFMPEADAEGGWD